MRSLVFLLIVMVWFPSAQAQSVKGLYVDGFSSILNNTVREDSLLQYAQANGFTYLALYELHLVHAQYDMTNYNSIAPLANFINRAKTQYGILQVGATAENYWFFLNRVHVYNQTHSNPDEQFDVYNLEFEFWLTSSTGPSGYYCTTYLQPGGYTCDTAGAFSFYLRELEKIDSLAGTIGKTSETYVGWPNQGQAHQIAAACDRILVHAYVTSDAAAYSYTQNRLSWFGTSAATASIIVIFSSEPTFMGPWLQTHQESQAWTTYSNAFSNDNSSWTSGISLLGYQWFAWTMMPYDLSTNVTTQQDNNEITVVQIENGLQIIFRNAIQGNMTIRIHDVSGKMISTSSLNYTGNEHFLSIPFVPCAEGVYITDIELTETGERYISKFIYTN